jgi:predicted phage terminase large subunit-like protein
MPLAPTTDQGVEHFERIATPLHLAQTMDMQVMGRKYRVYPWLKYVQRKVLEMLGRPGREILIVNIPPQEGKTTYFGFWLPAWYIGLNPDDQMMFITYSADYSELWGRRVRDFTLDHGQHLFGVGLNKSEQSVGNWKTTKGFGGMLSAGIDGGITGNPGHFIVIDDVIKNMQEALSAATKKRHLSEFDGSIFARLQEDTKMVISATRWAEDDLAGEVEARSLVPGYDGIPVTRINIKAIAEPEEQEELSLTDEELVEWTDFLGRHKGEFLTGQKSPASFEQARKTIGTYVWNSQYQGNPTARKGSMFPIDRWEYFDPENRPAMSVMRRVWDLATTEDGGDFTVGAHVGKAADGDYYILDIQREQLGVLDVRNLVKAKAKSDGRHVPVRIEREKAGAGKTTIEFYRAELMGWNFDEAKIEGEKIDRMGPYSILQQDRKIRLPRNPITGESPAWVKPFVDEHKMQMPDGRGPKHDDQIDAVAHAIIEMYDLGPVQASDPNEQFDPDQDVAVEDVMADHAMDVQDGIPEHLAKILGVWAESADDEVEVSLFGENALVGDW